MSVKDGKITVPISLQDPYTCMGVAKTGEYYDTAYICSNAHGRINEYSLKKPVRYNGPHDLPHAMSGFGVVPVSAGNKSNFRLEYQPPRPGVDYSRLNDFDGYDHKTPAPVLSPNEYSLTAVTPDNIGSDSTDTVFNISLLNSKKIINLIRAEQYGKHAIDQSILSGGASDVITDLVLSGDDDTISDVATIHLNSSLIALRNPNLANRTAFDFYFRSSVAGSESNAGAIYAFKNNPLSFSFTALLFGGSMLNAAIGQQVKAAAFMDVQSELKYTVPDTLGTPVIPDSKIKLVAMVYSSDGIYVNIVLSSTLDAATVNNLKAKLKLGIPSSGAEYYLGLFRGSIVGNKFVSDGRLTANSYDVVTYYTDNYQDSTQLGGNPTAVEALNNWCKGKPVIRFYCNVDNSTAPNQAYPVLGVRLAKL